jgi:hypothetical protein
MNFNINEIKTFVSENVTNNLLKNVGISSVILFVVIVSQLLIHEVVMVIDSIPVFNGIMQLIGLVVFVNFIRNNLLTQEQRVVFSEKVKSFYNQVVE